MRRCVATKDQAVSSRASATRSLTHVRRNDDGSFKIHHLEDHLRAVDVIAQCVIARRDSQSESGR
jgi:hypothetical protein